MTTDVSELVRMLFENGGVGINLEHPFTWTSGNVMPIYVNNKVLLCNHPNRIQVARAFENLIPHRNSAMYLVAGIATGGISPATTLADRLELPLIYVRPKPKGHGMQTQIEGIPPGNDLEGWAVLPIEDTISTGKSSLDAVKVIRSAGGMVLDVLSIFDYRFAESEKNFSEADCRKHSIISYDALVKAGKEIGKITGKQSVGLQEWRKDPFNWAAKYGFRKT